MSGSITSNTLSSIYSNSFAQYLQYSEAIGGTIFEQSICVDNVFKTTLDLVRNFNQYKRPLNPLAEQYLTEPLFQSIDRVSAFETRASDHIFQITLVSKSIKIFEWLREVEVEKFASKLHKYIQFYQQKALCEIETLGRTHFEWLKYWNETYEELSIFVVNFFKGGICWTGNETMPLDHVLGDSNTTQKSEERRALIGEIGRLGHASDESEESVPIFSSVDNKWLIENQIDNHSDLVVNTAKREEQIFVSQCQDCTVVIETFVSLISVDGCNRVKILFRSTSKVEVKNSHECNLHCFESAESLYLINCEKCAIHLTDKSLDSSINTQKCSDISVNFPFEDGLYKSFKIPDQLLTKIAPSQGLDTIIKI